ncbi:hypothetical protein MPSEU_000797500 [Mayamaea pseudoterrestris]|nr:hypothetical protein MPSEU_000797500 [Mayamaea pseudoterrestris]
MSSPKATSVPAPSTSAAATGSAAASNANAGKKAVHVKWSGRTIALGESLLECRVVMSDSCVESLTLFASPSRRDFSFC